MVGAQVVRSGGSDLLRGSASGCPRRHPGPDLRHPPRSGSSPPVASTASPSPRVAGLRCPALSLDVKGCKDQRTDERGKKQPGAQHEPELPFRSGIHARPTRQAQSPKQQETRRGIFLHTRVACLSQFGLTKIPYPAANTMGVIHDGSCSSRKGATRLLGVHVLRPRTDLA